MTTPTRHLIYTHNSLLFIRDKECSDFPEINSVEPVWVTSECVAICCIPVAEGQTELLLGSANEVPNDLVRVFEGSISTPTKTLLVCDVVGDFTKEIPVGTTRTSFEIWTDGDFVTAAKVFIGLNEPKFA